MTVTADALVQDYLDRLEGELAAVPRARRREILREIEDHIAAARAEGEGVTEAELRTLLDRLGDPAAIAAEAREDARERPPERHGGVHEIAAIVLLLVGGFVVVGWVVGVVLLWISDAWTRRDKLIGTLVVPFGLALPFVLLSFGAVASGGEMCTTESRLEGGAPSAVETCLDEGGSDAVLA